MVTLKPRRRKELQTFCGHASYIDEGRFWKAVLPASGFHGNHMDIAGLSCENPAGTYGLIDQQPKRTPKKLQLKIVPFINGNLSRILA